MGRQWCYGSEGKLQEGIDFVFICVNVCINFDVTL